MKSKWIYIYIESMKAHKNQQKYIYAIHISTYELYFNVVEYLYFVIADKYRHVYKTIKHI